VTRAERHAAREAAKHAYLTAIATAPAWFGAKGHSAKAVGVPEQRIRGWRRQDRAFDRAVERAVAQLRGAAVLGVNGRPRRRAFYGGRLPPRNVNVAGSFCHVCATPHVPGTPKKYHGMCARCRRAWKSTLRSAQLRRPS